MLVDVDLERVLGELEELLLQHVVFAAVVAEAVGGAARAAAHGGAGPHPRAANLVRDRVEDFFVQDFSLDREQRTD